MAALVRNPSLGRPVFFCNSHPLGNSYRLLVSIQFREFSTRRLLLGTSYGEEPGLVGLAFVCVGRDFANAIALNHHNRVCPRALPLPSPRTAIPQSRFENSFR